MRIHAYVSVWLYHFVVFASILGSQLTSVDSSDSSDSEDGPEIEFMNHYLYEDDFPPIIDYIVDDFNNDEDIDGAIMAYMAGADREGTAKRKEIYDNERNNPHFLNSTDNGPRVLEFYTPWCPNCQAYRYHYQEMAKQVHSIPEGANVKFYAISCTAHKPICKSLGIRKYPSLMGFKAGSVKGENWRRQDVSASSVLDKLGIAAVNKFSDKATSNNKATVDEDHYGEEQSEPKVTFKRTKADIYADATLSFDFTLRNEIYMDDGPLPDDARNALGDFLSLLHKAMPVSMKVMHNQIRAVRSNFGDVVQNEVALVEAIQNIRPKQKTWSKSCTHGKKVGGYTCGLWELFHIMTVGVAEWNLSDTLPSLARINTADAADALRGFVEQFFGCEVCQNHFLRAYDSCARDRCTRLNHNARYSMGNDFKELSLWLWEFHNDVNVRLLKEKAVRENKPPPSERMQQEVRWPSTQDCPRCWNDDGSWDKGVVYNLLRSEYWLEDDLSEEYHADLLENAGREKEQFKWENHLEAPVNESDSVFFSALFIPIGAVSFLSAYWFLQKKEKERTGRHKKLDTPVTYLYARAKK